MCFGSYPRGVDYIEIVLLVIVYVDAIVAATGGGTGNGFDTDEIGFSP